MIIYLASDHAGYFLKERIKQEYLDKGFLVEDFGAKNFDEVDDFPDFVSPCVKKFIATTNGDTKKGIAIVFGGSGTGEAIVANRIRGARAVVLNSTNMEIIKLSRAHNNANVLSVGARFVTESQCLEAIKVFTTTLFDGGRHSKRVLKMDL
jgi:ribose 5-phosphate isomerase B